MPDIFEVTIEDLKHLVSERAVTGETMLLNMGPQHPSTHGVLRLLLELDGEIVVTCIPDIGFLHTGIEKNMEAKTYQKAEVMTDRLDYLNTVGNNLAYSMAVEKLVKNYNALQDEYRGEVTLTIPRDHVIAICEQMKLAGFELLSTLTAVDYWPEENPRFNVIYQFTSISKNLSLRIRVPVPGVNPSLPSIAHIYQNANWRERELWDMFGIKAEGHPDLRRILMPADWEGHPLRKDYPLGYEEPQFSFNKEEIDQRKHYAQE